MPPESIGHDGTITVTTTRHPDMLEIADNGPGIAPEAAEDFQPFLLHQTQWTGHRPHLHPRSARPPSVPFSLSKHIPTASLAASSSERQHNVLSILMALRILHCEIEYGYFL